MNTSKKFAHIITIGLPERVFDGRMCLPVVPLPSFENFENVSLVKTFAGVRFLFVLSQDILNERLRTASAACNTTSGGNAKRLAV